MIFNCTRIYYLDEYQCLYHNRISENLHEVYLLDDVYFDGELWYPKRNILIVNTDELTFETYGIGISEVEFNILKKCDIVYYKPKEDCVAPIMAMMVHRPQSVYIAVVLLEQNIYGKGEIVYASRLDVVKHKNNAP